MTHSIGVRTAKRAVKIKWFLSLPCNLRFANKKTIISFYLLTRMPTEINYKIHWIIKCLTIQNTLALVKWVLHTHRLECVRCNFIRLTARQCIQGEEKGRLCFVKCHKTPARMESESYMGVHAVCNQRDKCRCRQIAHRFRWNWP